MNSSFLKKAVTTIIVLIIIGAGFFLFYVIHQNRMIPAPIVVPLVSGPQISIIGRSVEGRKIEAYSFGQASTSLLFIGGIHGGYEWNSVMLAYKFIDYLTDNPAIIPENLSITIIPAMNPDGLYDVTGKEGRFTLLDVKSDLPNGTGRFNANDVDLNRNFDCKWQATSTWKSNIVSAGTGIFSEPEAKAIRDFILKIKPSAVVFWHSQSNTIYASECQNGILPVTRDIMSAYSKASNYAQAETFTSYAITGDSGDWLASINIPAITVELQTHETIEWERNLAGIQALFKYFEAKTK